MSRHLAFSGHLRAAVPSGPMGRGRPSPTTWAPAPGPAACDAVASESLLLAWPLRSASAVSNRDRR